MPALTAFINGDAAQFQREMRKVMSVAQTTGDSITHHLGGAVAGFLSIEGAKRVVEYGEQIADLSKRLGISTDAVQEWDYALKMTGSSMAESVTFFEKLAVARKGALEGNEKSISSFNRLGVSIADLKNNRLEDVASQIARAFQSGDPQKLIADLREVGGRGAGQMVVAFREGLADLVNDAKAAGVVISEEVVNAMEDASRKGKRIWMQFTADLAPALAKLFEGVEWVWRRAGAGFAGLALLMRTGSLKATRELGAEYRKEWEAQDKPKEKQGGLFGGGDEADKSGAKAAQREAERILRLKERLFELQQDNDLKSLSKEEQVDELYRRRAAIIEAMKKSKTEEGRLNAAIDVEKIDAQLRTLEPKDEKSSLSSKLVHGSLTANQRIGAYSSPASSVMIDTAKKSERHLSELVALAKRRGTHNQSGVKY